jgi:enamine deaminase RidA (YjgF/YER057c/UK114 family)
MNRNIINPWKWQDELGFVQANNITDAERMLVCAGQTSVDANGTPKHEGDMHAQIQLCLDNLEAVLKQADMTLANVVRLNYYTTDVERFFEASDALTRRLAAAGCRPAATLLGIVRLAFPPLLVEIEATAIV